MTTPPVPPQTPESTNVQLPADDDAKITTTVEPAQTSDNDTDDDDTDE